MKRKILLCMMTLGLFLFTWAGTGPVPSGSALAASELSLTPGEDGIIHLSEADSREFFGIEKDNYIPIPDTNLQFLMSKKFYMSGANGQDHHVMTVSDVDNLIHDQVYAQALSGSSQKGTPIEINGMMGTLTKYEGDMIVVEVELEAEGKVSSMTAHTEADESHLAALLGLFSPAVPGGSAETASEEVPKNAIDVSVPVGYGPVLVAYGHEDEDAYSSGEIFSVYSPDDGATLALLEGGGWMAEGYFENGAGVLDWKVQNEEGETLAAGQEIQLSSYFEFVLPNCFETGHAYQLILSSGGETQTLNLNVIEGDPEQYPRNEKLEIVEPAGDVLYPDDSEDEDDGEIWYRLAWKESGYGLVHVLVQNEIFDILDENFNPSMEEDGIDSLYLPENAFEFGSKFTIIIEQGDQTASKTFTVAKADGTQVSAPAVPDSASGAENADESTVLASAENLSQNPVVTGNANMEDIVGRWDLFAETDGTNTRYAAELKEQASILLYETGTAVVIRRENDRTPVSRHSWTQQDSNVMIGENAYLLEDGQLMTSGSADDIRQIFHRVSWPMSPLSTVSAKSADEFYGYWRGVAANYGGIQYLLPAELVLVGTRDNYTLSIAERGALITLPGNRNKVEARTLTSAFEYGQLRLNVNASWSYHVSLCENGWISLVIGQNSSTPVTLYLRRASEEEAAEGIPALRSPIDLTVSSQKGITSVTAGKTAKFAAAFENTAFVNAKGKNNQVTWSVLDADGNPSSDATIDAKGTLKVNKTLEIPKEVTVKAVSEKFGTSDAVTVTLVPQVTAVHIEPAAVSLFLTDGAQETITVSLEPASVPLEGLTWTASPKNIIEIEDHGDGTAVIRPLKAGKATGSVKEGGGKTGKFTVTVMQPAEALELSVKGKALPGKTLTISAKLSPKNVTDKTLTWAVDTDESIATISSKGQLKISKDAPVGTVITVSCTAEGAPQPIRSTLSVTVEGK